MRVEEAVHFALEHGSEAAVDQLLSEWLRPAVARMKAKGTEGAFSAKARAAGMDTLAYANRILNAPEGAHSGALRKQANFARNAIRISRRRKGG